LKKAFLLSLIFLLLPLQVLAQEERVDWKGIYVKEGDSFKIGNYSIEVNIIQRLGQYFVNIKKGRLFLKQIQYFPASPSMIRTGSVREGKKLMFHILFDRSRSNSTHAYIEILDSIIWPPYALITLEIDPMAYNITHARKINIKHNSHKVILFIENKGTVSTNITLNVHTNITGGNGTIEVYHQKSVSLEPGKRKLIALEFNATLRSWALCSNVTIEAEYSTPWVKKGNKFYNGMNGTSKTWFLLNFYQKEDRGIWESSSPPSRVDKAKGILEEVITWLKNVFSSIFGG